MATIRVLLIEDDQAYARLIARMLRLAPIEFDVTVADRLTMALGELYKSRFNLILMDLNLPDITGLDTIDVIRSAEANLPIVALTGEEDAEIEERVIERGAQICLRKSDLKTKKLLDAMHEAVQLSRKDISPTVDRKVDRFLSELEENIIAVKNAVSVLEGKQRDVPQRDAVHTIRSHIGKMQDKIGGFRREKR
jgi:two-component system, cell cycle sensor histidine kinase and response regulator CckA